MKKRCFIAVNPGAGEAQLGYQHQELHLARAQTRVSVPHWLSRSSAVAQVRQDGVAQTLLSVLVMLGTIEQFKCCVDFLAASQDDTSILSFANGTSSRPGIPSSTVSQKYAA